MIKTITTSLIIMLVGLTSMAQGEPQKEITSLDRAKMFVSRLAQKVELTKNQKDSITLIYTQYMDDIQKYRAENNAKVIMYMMKSRDEKIKLLLHDDLKYEQYLLFLEDIQKQRDPQQRPPEQKQKGGQQHMGGQQNPMGNGDRM